MRPEIYLLSLIKSSMGIYLLMSSLQCLYLLLLSLTGKFQRVA